ALFLAIGTGGAGSILLFAFTSFMALREFITLTPTRKADHRTLFWAFFIITPIHYYLLWKHWYGMFSIFIPVYAFLFIPLRIAIAGDTENYLARTSMIQWALMICVFCVSHAPALLMLDIPGYEGQNIKLLMFLILVTQLSDVFQYVFGKTLGKHKIAPKVSPNKTWEGFVGGIGTAVAVGTGLWWITPFNPLQTALIALSITLAGFAGGLCMSAIKRDRGVKDFGTIIEGHGGMLDRIDSICFAAPIYFHIIRYFFTI
ncbi:MAG: phosphatidate cytidylyltransferase, partial [Phycisphaeraceae bacterium JB051]